ncbi:MAG: 50S ribosomal protein L11 methyltransferase [Bacteroidales bacterium]|nr:50S ribosomal protein L11 methyltransferase [Bacteroidales bacterium]
MDYYRLRLECDPCTEDITDLLAQFLADAGYESFEPDDSGLTAYIKSDDFSEASILEIKDSFPMDTRLEWKAELEPGKDWNEEWERNYFQPIVIAGECVVHASFHTDIPEARFDILIDPKMAFGTGHHATTSQMVRYILDFDSLEGKSVIDMGTGTGILALLCKMRGASDVTGIEIDPDAYANAVDNAALNNQAIDFKCGDAAQLQDCRPADIFLANINRNIITADLPRYAERIKNGGVLLLSGFYTADIPVVMEHAEPLGFVLDKATEEGDHWAAIRLIKKS